MFIEIKLQMKCNLSQNFFLSHDFFLETYSWAKVFEKDRISWIGFYQTIGLIAVDVDIVFSGKIEFRWGKALFQTLAININSP